MFPTKFATCILCSSLCLLLNSALVAVSQEFPPTERVELNPSWTVRGHVKAPSGRPLIGVNVYHDEGIYYQPMMPDGMKDGIAAMGQARTDFSGGFEIEVRENAGLLFVTNGFAPLKVNVPAGSAIDVQLQPGRTISGTILMPSGEPAVEAIVKPANWRVPADRSVDLPLPQPVSGSFPNDERAVKTDGQGKFTLKHLPEKSRVGISVSAKGAQEEVVYVRFTGDNEPLEWAGQVLKQDGFEFQMSLGSVLNLQATDAQTGQPAAIARVITQPTNNLSNPKTLRRTVSFNRPSVAANLPTYPEGCIVWVEPVDHTNLLGLRFELPPNPDPEEFEKKVEFQRGKLVQGKVTSSATGDPLEGVQVRWRQEKGMSEQDDQGNAAALNAETDSHGQFEFSVPDVDGLIGIIGDVPGHCSVDDWFDREMFEDSAPEVFREFTRPLKQGQLDDLEPFEFELRPSYQVEFTVVLDGNPIPNCVVIGARKDPTIFTGHNFVSMSVDQTPISKVTDQNGRTTFKDWYDDSLFLAKARSQQGKPAQPGSMAIYPSEIQAFHADGLNQGSATIPLPKVDSTSNVIPVTIELKPAGIVLGQVLSTEGNPISGLSIWASSGDHTSGQT